MLGYLEGDEREMMRRMGGKALIPYIRRWRAWRDRKIFEIKYKEIGDNTSGL